MRKRVVVQCQGSGRYAIRCERRVVIGTDGYALCKPHQEQKRHLQPVPTGTADQKGHST